MRTYRCLCNNVTFFDNSHCLSCHRDLGFCPGCRLLVSLLPHESGHFECGNPSCGILLDKCFNYVEHNVCNRMVAVAPQTTSAIAPPVVGGAPSTNGAASPVIPSQSAPSVMPPPLCDCCRFNATIPDLAIPGNWEKWHRLETAKRRLFYELCELGLPFGTASDGVQPPLSFDFKADVISKQNIWKGGNKGEKVFTGHTDGKITINIREADDVAREKLRVDMGEAHRTLIGHFRHEIGHYYWDLIVKGRPEREAQSMAVFGDHNQPTYAEALEAYYQNGPPADWSVRFVSAYATMHPWEDFAETWAAYLDMIASLDTAQHVGLRGQTDAAHAEFDPMLRRYQELGIALNELNRTMGLLDLVPEVFVPSVVEKLRFIHQLVQLGRSENGILQPSERAASGV